MPISISFSSVEDEARFVQCDITVSRDYIIARVAEDLREKT